MIRVVSLEMTSTGCGRHFIDPVGKHWILFERPKLSVHEVFNDFMGRLRKCHRRRNIRIESEFFICLKAVKLAVFRGDVAVVTAIAELLNENAEAVVFSSEFRRIITFFQCFEKINVSFVGERTDDTCCLFGNDQYGLRTREEKDKPACQ